MAATDDDPGQPPVEQLAVEPRTGITASVELVNHTWGVEYVLHAEGLTPDRKYRVFYETADGARLTAGSFLGVEGALVCRMTAAVTRERLRAIEVLEGRDDVVLRSRLT